MAPQVSTSNVSYFSTALLKGGKSTYAGNVVRREAKSGRIVSVKKVDEVEG